jgi:tRNA U54 and U55 pseudouridine synthase Pus10
MTFQEFINSKDWELFVEDTHPNDDNVSKMYDSVNDKPKCRVCGETFDDIDSFYQARTCQFHSVEDTCLYCSEEGDY